MKLGFSNSQKFAEMKAKTKAIKHQHQFRHLDSSQVVFTKSTIPDWILNDVFWQGIKSPDYEAAMKFTDEIAVSDYFKQYESVSDRQSQYENSEESDNPFMLSRFFNQPNAENFIDFDQYKKIDLSYPNKLDRILLEDLQEMTWNSQKSYRPPQLITKAQSTPQPLHQWIKSTPDEATSIQSLIDDLGLSYQSQKVINQLIAKRDKSMTPDEVDLLQMDNRKHRKNRFILLIKAIRKILAGKSEGDILDELATHLIKTLNIENKQSSVRDKELLLQEVLNLNHTELFTLWSSISVWYQSIRTKEIRNAFSSIAKLDDNQVKSLYIKYQGTGDISKKDMVIHIISEGFETSKNWLKAKQMLWNCFCDEFNYFPLTIKDMHSYFVEPSRYEMRERLEEAGALFEERLSSAVSNSGHNLEWLIDIKTSQLESLDVSDSETLQEIKDRFLEWQNLSHYEPDCYFDSSKFYHATHEKEQDDKDSEDFEYESLESDEKAPKSSDQDAFTYSSCGNFTIPQRCSQADAAILRACRDCQTLEDLRFFKKLQAKDMESSWDTYRVLKDTIFFTEKRINS